MNEELVQRVEALLRGANLAANPATNGPLDRGDLEEVIAELSTTICQLRVACEGLTRERDLFLERLSRFSGRPRELAAPTAVSYLSP